MGEHQRAMSEFMKKVPELRRQLKEKEELEKKKSRVPSAKSRSRSKSRAKIKKKKKRTPSSLERKKNRTPSSIERKKKRRTPSYLERREKKKRKKSKIEPEAVVESPAAAVAEALHGEEPELVEIVSEKDILKINKPDLLKWLKTEERVRSNLDRKKYLHDQVLGLKNTLITYELERIPISLPWPARLAYNVGYVWEWLMVAMTVVSFYLLTYSSVYQFFQVEIFYTMFTIDMIFLA